MTDEYEARLRDEARQADPNSLDRHPRFVANLNHRPVYETGPDGTVTPVGDVKGWSVVDVLHNVWHGQAGRFDSLEDAEAEADRLNGMWRRALRLEGRQG